MAGKWGIGLGDTKQHLEIWRDGFIAPVVRLIEANSEEFKFELLSGRKVSLELELLRKRYCSNVVTAWINSTPSPYKHDWRAFGDFLIQFIISLENQREGAQVPNTANQIFRDSESDTSDDEPKEPSLAQVIIQSPSICFSRSTQFDLPVTKRQKISDSPTQPLNPPIPNFQSSLIQISDQSSDSDQSEDEETLSNLEIVTQILNIWKTPGNVIKTKRSCLNLTTEATSEAYKLFPGEVRRNPRFLRGFNIPDSLWPTMKTMLDKGGVMENERLQSMFNHFGDLNNLDDEKMIKILQNYQEDSDRKEFFAAIKILQTESKLLASIFACYKDSKFRKQFDDTIECRLKKPRISSGKCLIPYINKVSSFSELFSQFQEKVGRHKLFFKPWKNSELTEIMETIFIKVIATLS